MKVLIYRDATVALPLWLGLRDAQAEHYRASGHDFEADQQVYRDGFEAALRRECRSLAIDQQSDCLKWWYPNTWDSEPFRRGYEQGQKYSEQQVKGEVLAGHR